MIAKEREEKKDDSNQLLDKWRNFIDNVDNAKGTNNVNNNSMTAMSCKTKETNLLQLKNGR